ncbi:hypothetical protein D3C80_1999560 [compost metagenome]
MVALRGEVTFEAGEKKKAIDANAESQATITTLRAEAQRNADYLKDLNKRLEASKAKARKAEKNFEDLKRNSKPVRDWAAQPLPDGLRGKASAGSGKDNSGASRAP